MHRAVPLIALIVLIASTATRAVDPDSARLGALAEPLSKKIDVQFIETPLRRVIEQLQQRSGVTFVLEREALGSNTDLSISLEARALPLEEVLDLVARQGDDVGWEVTGTTVIISSRRRIEYRSRVTQVYDIRPLLVAIPNFKAPSLDLDTALDNTNTGGSKARMSDVSTSGGGSGVSESMFGDVDDAESGSISRLELIESIVSLIQDTIGRPEDWQALGGDLSSVRELRGSLIVHTTPKNHAHLTRLLKELSDDGGRLVNIEARFIQLPTTALDGLLGQDQLNHVLDIAQARALLAKIGEGNAARLLGITRTVCFNGQRVYLAANRQALFLSDAEPVPDGVGVDPVLSTARSGAVLDLEPTIAMDGKSVVVTLRGDMATPIEMRRSIIRVGTPPGEPRIHMGGSVAGDVKKPDAEGPAKLNGSVSTGGTITPGEAGRFAEISVDMPTHEGLEYRSSVRIPDGGAVLLSGMSRELKSVSADSEVVLILRVRSSQ